MGKAFGLCLFSAERHNPGCHGQTCLPLGLRKVRHNRVSTVKRVWRCHPSVGGDENTPADAGCVSPQYRRKILRLSGERGRYEAAQGLSFGRGLRRHAGGIILRLVRENAPACVATGRQCVNICIDWRAASLIIESHCGPVVCFSPAMSPDLSGIYAGWRPCAIPSDCAYRA